MKTYDKGIQVIVVVLFAFIIFYGLVHQVLCLKFPYPLEYREGVVQLWVNNFINGQSLYPKIQQTPPYLHNPYTPLYYMITGFFQRIMPDAYIFLAGRILSFLSMLLSCFFIFKISCLKSKKIAGLLASALFFCSPVVINYGCLEIVDMMALCFGLAGIYLALKKGTSGMIFSGIMCACSILVKPVFILPFISILVSNGFSRDNKKKYFLATSAGCLIIAFSVLFYRYRLDIFNHLIILNRLPLSFSHFMNVFANIGIRHTFLFCALCVFIGLMKDKNDPVYWYCIFSPITLLFSAKIGSEANYFLEVIALSAISSGIIFATVNTSMKKIVLIACIAQIFLFLPFKPAPVFTKTYGQELPATISSEPTNILKEAGDMIIGELMSVFDPVLSEDIGWLISAKKEVIIEPYQFSQLAKYGRWNDTYIVEMIKEKQFNLILMSTENYEGSGEKFTKNMLESIKENYSVKRIIGNTYILEPMFWADNNKNW